MKRDTYSKLKTIDELAKILNGLRKLGKKIVHCHGVFDLLHPGHIKHFEAAKRKGDILVVTITRDEYVNKGPGRPIFNQNLRAESIAAFECVDFVAINEWPTAVETIKKLRPLFRNAISFIYRFIINTTFLVNFNYTNGTVLCRKSILKELEYRSSGFLFQTDILIRMVKKGYLFSEVPYRLGLRKEGISKAISFPSLLRVVKGYLRLIKDLYFNNKGRKIKAPFSSDSLTAIRRKDKQDLRLSDNEK